jgi:hypothetical protein
MPSLLVRKLNTFNMSFLLRDTVDLAALARSKRPCVNPIGYLSKLSTARPAELPAPTTTTRWPEHWAASLRPSP